MAVTLEIMTETLISNVRPFYPLGVRFRRTTDIRMSIAIDSIRLKVDVSTSLFSQ